jgi:acyl dehydratase
MKRASVPNDEYPLADPLWTGRPLGSREICVTEEHVRKQLFSIGVEAQTFYESVGPSQPAICPASVLFYEPMEFAGPREHEGGRAAFNAGIHWKTKGLIRVGERLLLEARVSDRWLKRGREYAIFEVTAHNSSGDCVAVGGFKESWDQPAEYTPPLENRDGMSGGWREEPTGPQIGQFDCCYSDEMSAAFAGPIRNLHTDIEMANRRGFDRLVIAGPQLAAQMSELMTRLFGFDYLEAGELKVNLLRPVFAGDTIRVRAMLMDQEAEPSSLKPTRLALLCVNQRGTIVAGGTAAARYNAATEQLRANVRA